MNPWKFIWIFVACTAVLSCSTTRSLPEGQYRLAGSKIVMEGQRGTFRPSELNSYVRQKPNSTFLGINPLLNIYDWLRMAGFNAVWSLIGSVGTILGIIFIAVESASNNENAMAVSAVLMFILGIIAVVLQIMSCFKIAKRFGQGIGIGFLFLLFAPIMCMVAGFSKDWTYHPKL